MLEVEKLGIARKGSIRSITRGVSNTSTVRLTMGKAISQFTSGLRRVLGWGLSRNTLRKTRTRLNAVRVLVSSTTPASRGWPARKVSTINPKHQKQPSGNRPVSPAAATR